MIKVALVVGTRPEAIKMAPVYLELRNSPKFEVVMIATAQHRTMLDQVFGVFGIAPDYDLNVMEDNQTLFKPDFQDFEPPAADNRERIPRCGSCPRRYDYLSSFGAGGVL